MYALVQNNEIVKFFNYPKSFELNGNKYSSKIFSLFSNEEKNAIGIYEVSMTILIKKMKVISLILMSNLSLKTIKLFLTLELQLLNN
jgi:hypothetical protein